MSKKIIFVNATSATVGGTLTIVNQFIENICDLNEKDKKYYIFVPLEYEASSNELIEFIHVKAKKYVDRIKWDMFGIKRWAKVNNIKPNLIISLQNTAVRFEDTNQLVYLHQPLPYSKESSWNILKKDERKMWFYKYLYKIWIDCTVKKNHKIVVQTEWMKRALIKDGYHEKNILISKPDIAKFNINEINTTKKDKKYFFYPAADYKYKNHKVIIDAIKKISESREFSENSFMIVFTLSKSSQVYDMVAKYKLEKYFDFVGQLSYDNVLSYYKGCQAMLFPSYIETFGLPLIEGSIFGKRILVSDCEYSREVLGRYTNAKFIKYDDSNSWAKEIELAIREYEVHTYLEKQKSGWNSMFQLINTLI